jgi:hypothetical protein
VRGSVCLHAGEGGEGSGLALAIPHMIGGYLLRLVMVRNFVRIFIVKVARCRDFGSSYGPSCGRSV